MTDMATCVGPPDMIAMGSPTVLIGNLMAARMGRSDHSRRRHRPWGNDVMIGEVGMGTPVVETPNVGVAVPPMVALGQRHEFGASSSLGPRSVSGDTVH